MRRLIIIGVVLAVLIIAGGLTAQMAADGGTATVPWVIRTTSNPDASVMDMTPWKAEQLFLVIGFVLFNLLGAGITVMLIFWLLHRQVKRVKSQNQVVTSSPPRPTESARVGFG
ncbi:MAG TPA: hypothetical protein VHO69_09210 [Phototrophicaceae bacterium]|nr:hypothetical protein [Phototrophicaceae bacterium]